MLVKERVIIAGSRGLIGSAITSKFKMPVMVLSNLI
jgi:hypothetical protein